MIHYAQIIQNKKIGENFYHLILKTNDKFLAKPGQFVNILIDDNSDIFLRRPFSIFDLKNKRLEIIYKVIGKGTKILKQKRKGEKINFIGPLGNSYIDYYDKNLNDKNEILLIAGGTGIASLHFFCQWLHKNKIKFILLYGARTKKELIFPDYFKKSGTFFTTEDGSYGRKGIVLDFVKRLILKDTTIFSCGPKSMLKALQNMKIKNKIYASFEEFMGCGFGVCLSCAIPVKNGDDFEFQRVCKEGPVFDLKNIIFKR